MFSGIVEEVGTVQRWLRRGDSASLTIRAGQVLEGTRLGDSIAVNGTCLTVTRLSGDTFSVDLTPETLRRTNLGLLLPGDPVNLERSLAVGSRIGGHFVQGHVDGVGQVRTLRREGASVVIGFSAPPEVMRYVVVKGFIAVDGMSLTVVDRLEDGFTVAIIPYTLEHTIAGNYRVGTVVNLEADILGKYVERLLEGRRPHSGLTEAFLSDRGFIE